MSDIGAFIFDEINESIPGRFNIIHIGDFRHHEAGQGSTRGNYWRIQQLATGCLSCLCLVA